RSPHATLPLPPAFPTRRSSDLPPGASDGLGDTGHLGVPQRIRDRVDRGLVEDLPIAAHHARQPLSGELASDGSPVGGGDREILRSEEQRLNSSHGSISYAVLCL